MVPWKSFVSRYTLISEFDGKIGTDPEKKLLLTENNTNFGSAMMPSSIVPCSRLEDKSSDCRDNSIPIDGGRVPLSLLYDKSKLSKVDSRPMEEGIAPRNPYP